MSDRDEKPGIGKETVRAFVFGELGYDEALVVERAVANSEELQQWAREYEQTQELLYQARMEELSEVLPDPGSSTTGPQSPNNPRWPWFLGLFAILVILGFAGWQVGNHADEAIAQRHFLMPLDPRVAGNTNEQELFDDALDAFFLDGDYSSARTGFHELVQLGTNFETTSQYLLSHADFLLGDYVSAAREFDTTITDEQLRIAQRQRARWNAMLTDLAQGDNIGQQLNGNWPADWRTPLEEDLNSVWR